MPEKTPSPQWRRAGPTSTPRPAAATSPPSSTRCSGPASPPPPAPPPDHHPWRGPGPRPGDHRLAVPRPPEAPRESAPEVGRAAGDARPPVAGEVAGHQAEPAHPTVDQGVAALVDPGVAAGDGPVLGQERRQRPAAAVRARD